MYTEACLTTLTSYRPNVNVQRTYVPYLSVWRLGANRSPVSAGGQESAGLLINRNQVSTVGQESAGLLINRSPVSTGGQGQLGY